MNETIEITKLTATYQFQRWMRQVDECIRQRTGGMDSNDLPDCTYSDWFADGVTARGAASRAIKYAKGEE